MTKCCGLKMAEREALKKEIEQLQNLINNYKSSQSDAPSSSAEWDHARHPSRRGRGRGLHYTNMPNSLPQSDVPYSSKTWRKTYSLNNKKTNTTGKPMSNPIHDTPKEPSPPEEQTQRKCASSPFKMTKPQSEPQMKIKPTLKSYSSVNVLPVTSIVKPDHQLYQVQTQLPVSMPFSKNVPSVSVQPHVPSGFTKSQQKPSLSQPSAHSQKSLKFKWVKNQDIPNTTKTDVSHSPAVSPGTASFRRLSGCNKKTSRKTNSSPSSSKNSKYTWVSSTSSVTAGKTNKVLRRSFPPKTLKVPVRTSQVGQKALRCATSPTPNRKSKSGGFSPLGHTSKYRWKAAGQNAVIPVSSSVGKSSRKNTIYQWTACKNAQRGAKGPAHSPSLGHTALHTDLPSPGGFKLRSRTKIIRKSTSNLWLERKSSPNALISRSSYSLRRRTHAQAKSPTSVKRTPPKVLVPIGRHKLRSLSLTSPSYGSPGTGRPSSLIRTPAANQVIKTRYKIDARKLPANHHNFALSFRVKRLQSARMLLQNRLRMNSEGQWRGRSMRWIGGALYRVSANKLSRTHTTSTPNRSGHWSSPDVSSIFQGRPSATRYVASRAVQKSLAIIRQSRQKKLKAKQYCMYYNRFGKCNLGDACTYIHDPDKVAVCTRFLRGTCKQISGTCPFSHKVAKDKMPVCSYFLKGICNNSSCPYSHVYVSRKADVCKDFIRGYCPQGDKCKKQHTLVCPEFSSTGVCPRGSKCKLHHRQRLKRSGCNTSSGPAKKSCTKGNAKRLQDHTLSLKPVETDKASSSKSTEKLPSFISLSSSPDTPESTDFSNEPPAAGSKGTGKTLHIKPRFLFTTQTEPAEKEG